MADENFTRSVPGAGCHAGFGAAAISDGLCCTCTFWLLASTPADTVAPAPFWSDILPPVGPSGCTFRNPEEALGVELCPHEARTISKNPAMAARDAFIMSPTMY
jgi:hypothetical protein